MADAPNAVRDPGERIDELLAANNVEVERRRAAEMERDAARKRYDDFADGFWRIVDGSTLRGALPSSELDTLTRIVRRLEGAEADLELEKQNNAILFEALWNIKSAAEVAIAAGAGRPDVLLEKLGEIKRRAADIATPTSSEAPTHG